MRVALLAVLAVLLFPACVHESECLEGAEERDGVCRPIGDMDAGEAVDGGTTDGGDAGPDAVCDDGVACTEDSVVDGGCEWTPNDGLCTSVECAVGRCDAESGCIFTYDDSMCPARACNTVRCDETDGCTYTAVPDGTACDDGTFCNGPETCAAGSCVSPGDPCPGMSTCDEGMGRCTGCVGDSDCPDDTTSFDACSYGSQCATTGTRTATITTYMCDAGTCTSSVSMMPDTAGCTRTTAGDTCTSDGNECTRDVCAGGVCTNPDVAAGTPCTSDGNPCTDDVCRGGTCRNDREPDGTGCPGDANPCTRDICQSGACAHPVLADGTSCSGGYCCSAACVPRNSNNHCGTCSTNCAAAGQTCTNAISNNVSRHNIPGAFVCTCTGFADCSAAGYGGTSTCFGNHCQCHCPGGGPARCPGICDTGFCNNDFTEDRSDNFCEY